MNTIITLLAVSAKAQSTTSTTTEDSIVLLFHTPPTTQQSTMQKTAPNDSLQWLWKLTNFEISIFLLILVFGIIWVTREVTKRYRKSEAKTEDTYLALNLTDGRNSVFVRWFDLGETLKDYKLSINKEVRDVRVERKWYTCTSTLKFSWQANIIEPANAHAPRQWSYTPVPIRLPNAINVNHGIARQIREILAHSDAFQMHPVVIQPKSYNRLYPTIEVAGQQMPVSLGELTSTSTQNQPLLPVRKAKSSVSKEGKPKESKKVLAEEYV